MAKIIGRLLTALFLLAFSSCSVVKEVPMSGTYRRDFLNRSADYIEMVCGRPTLVRTLPDGKALVYSDAKEFACATGYEFSVDGKKSGINGKESSRKESDSSLYGKQSSKGPEVIFVIGEDGRCKDVRTNHFCQKKEFSKERSWVAIGTSVGIPLSLLLLRALVATLFVR